MPDSIPYNSIDAPRKKTLKIRRSVFVCRMAPVDTIENAKAYISTIAKENKNATHNCWAYVLGDQGQFFHSSDAGEPAGTAGKPMLQILQSCRMTQVAAVVTRFFGGVKLGVRGLINAYGESVQATVDMAPLKPIIHLAVFDVELAYDVNEIFLSRMNPLINRISATEYSEKIVHTIEIELKYLEKAEQFMSDLQSQKKLIYSLKQTD